FSWIVAVAVFRGARSPWPASLAPRLQFPLHQRRENSPERRAIKSLTQSRAYYRGGCRCHFGQCGGIQGCEKLHSLAPHLFLSLTVSLNTPSDERSNFWLEAASRARAFHATDRAGVAAGSLFPAAAFKGVRE